MMFRRLGELNVFQLMMGLLGGTPLSAEEDLYCKDRNGCWEKKDDVIGQMGGLFGLRTSLMCFADSRCSINAHDLSTQNTAPVLL